MLIEIKNPFPLSQQDNSDQIVELLNRNRTDLNRTRQLIALLTYSGSFTHELSSKIDRTTSVFVIQQIQYWISKLENFDGYHKICDSLKKCIDSCVDYLLSSERIFDIPLEEIEIFKPYYEKIFQYICSMKCYPITEGSMNL
jgi:hypothetical protein